MGTSKKINLPPGFVLDEEPRQEKAKNLPSGFVLDDVSKKPEISKTESALMGAAEGGSLGFADELVAALEAKRHVPGLVAPAQAAVLAFSPEKRQEAVETYLKTRDAMREKMAEAREANPKTFKAGELAGGAATAFVPGLGEMTALKMAALGGIMGLGSSERELTDPMLAADIGAGAGLGVATHGGIKAGTHLLKATPQIGSMFLEKASKLPNWLADIVKKRGEAIYKSEGTPQTVKTAIETIQDIVTKGRQKAGEALQAVKEKYGVGDETLRAEAYEMPTEEIKITPTTVRQRAMALLSPEGPQGKESIRDLIDLRKDIDKLIYHEKSGLPSPRSKEETILKILRSDINKKIDSIVEPEMMPKSIMGVESQTPTGVQIPVGREIRIADKEFHKAADIYEGLQNKFKDVPTGTRTIKTQLQERLGSVDPDVKNLSLLPGGEAAMENAKNEVARFLVETEPKQPNNIAQIVAGRLGITPERAAKWLSLIGEGDVSELAQKYPKLAGYARLIVAAAERGIQELNTTDFLLQQQDEDYRILKSALSGGD